MFWIVFSICDQFYSRSRQVTENEDTSFR